MIEEVVETLALMMMAILQPNDLSRAALGVLSSVKVAERRLAIEYLRNTEHHRAAEIGDTPVSSPRQPGIATTR